MSLFDDLTDDEKKMLADHLRYAPFTKDETITREGAVAHWLYILREGKARITVNIDGIQKTINDLEAPDFFGEMGMMTGEPRAASVLAVTDVECFRLDKAGFQTIITERPEIAAKISETLASRRVDLIRAARRPRRRSKKSLRQKSEQERILARIQSFFGLSS